MPAPTPHQKAQPNPPSLLTLLRALIPSRPTTPHEHRRIAELQANKLRRLLRVTDPQLTTEIVVGLPWLKVVYDPSLPTSGMSFWNGNTWIVVLQPNEPGTRQRFTLLHEVHHIICHPKNRSLFGVNAPVTSPAAERMADLFAACALMPKRYVKRLHGQGVGQPTQLAEYFEVSDAAMSVRLQQLGLEGPTQPSGKRCIAHHESASRGVRS